MVRLSHLLAMAFLAVCMCLLTPAVFAEDPQGLDPERLQKVRETLDRRIEHYVNWLGRMYELTPEQQEQVRKRLTDLREEHLKYGPQVAPEIERLRADVNFYNAQARKGQPVPKEKIKELKDNLTALMDKAPMNFSNVIAETEKLLPAPQVAAGRVRQEEFRERNREASERERRKMPPPMQTGVEPLRPYIDEPKAPTAPPVDRPAQAAGEPGPAAGPGARPVTPAAAGQDTRVTVIPLDDWARHVQGFINRYKLNTQQAEQAWQIYGELHKRAAEYRTARGADYAAIERVTDPKLHNEELAAMDKPIQEMFTELKNRIEGIPTEAQRKEAGETAPAVAAGNAPATRPAVTSRPAATRPAVTSAPASRPANAAVPANAGTAGRR